MIIPDPLSNPAPAFSQDLVARRPTSAKYPIFATVIAAAGGDLFTVPSGEYWRIEKISIFNSNASAETIDIYLIEPGDTAATTNQIASQSVATDETVALDYLTGVVMGAGQSLNMNAVNSDSVAAGGVTRFFQSEFRD